MQVPTGQRMNRDTRKAIDAVNNLIESVTWLACSLLPGTARPYAPKMSAEQRAEIDAKDRLYRQVVDIGTGSTMPLGESPAPLSLGVMDLLVTILETGQELAGQASVILGWNRMPAATSAFCDPTPYLKRLLTLLPSLPVGDLLADDDYDIVDAIATRCADLVFQANSELGLIVDGQLLDALCPWCDGRTPRHPNGGAKTLRVRMLDMGSAGEFPAIVCEGNLCEPPETDVGSIRYRGMPTWPLDTEGAWLAQRIEHADLKRQEAS